MSAFVRFGIFLIGWLGLTAGAAAVEVVNGSWTLQANALLPEQEIPCSFEGSAQVVQDGTEFNGTAELTLSGGPDACPAEMMASINGVIDGTQVSGQLEGGNLGLADFSGNLISDDRESTTRAVSNGSGNFSVLTGPYASVGGAWGGTYRAQTTSDAIPALGVPGLVLLALFLIGLSAYLLQRQKRPL